MRLKSDLAYCETVGLSIVKVRDALCPDNKRRVARFNPPIPLESPLNGKKAMVSANGFSISGYLKVRKGDVEFHPHKDGVNVEGFHS
jgi:hypothetical protein